MNKHLRNLLLILGAPAVLLVGLAGIWLIIVLVKHLAEDDDAQG